MSKKVPCTAKRISLRTAQRISDTVGESNLSVFQNEV